jgi:ATP-dependent Clp protease ATP-binding subunit ClpB
MGSLGFLGDREKGEAADLKAKVMEALKENFRPEFLNRIDEIVIFNYLDKENIKKIVELELQKVTKRLEQKNIELKLTPAAKDILAEQGFDQNLGARPLKRAIQKAVLDPLALKIVSGEVKNKDHVLIDGQDNQIIFREWQKVSSKS